MTFSSRHQKRRVSSVQISISRWAMRWTPFSWIAESPERRAVVLVQKDTPHSEEVAILSRLAHPNIVSLLDAATSSVNDSYVIAVARLIPHQQVPDLTTSVTWAIGYARNVLEGLKYLHKQRIIHRDVKPSNVMYCSTDRCWKLIDFDLAVQLSSDESLVTGRCGTKGFIAPEVINCLFSIHHMS